MPTQLQIRRGSSTDHNSFTGAAGELTVDTTKDTLRVHDGSTAGGFELARADGSNLNNITNNITVNGSVTADGLTVEAGANATNILSLSGGAVGRTLTVQSYDTTLGGAGFDINATASAGEITLQTNTKDRLRIGSNGDVSLFEDTGTTAKFFWDSSEESLGIGTSPSRAFHVNSGLVNVVAKFESSDSIAVVEFADSNTTSNPNMGGEGNDLRFVTSANERIRISSGGDVGIGTSAPDAVLHANKTVASGDAPFIFENSGTSGTCTSSVVFAANGGGGAEKARIKAAVRGDGYMAFHTNDDSEKMRIDSSGHVIVPNGVTLGTAVGTYAAANTLDDYEEGTFTPVVADASSGGNTATGTANGWYTKVGNLVTIGVRFLNLDTTGMTSSNDLFIRGLPFASSSTSYGNVGGVLLDRLTFTGYVVPVQQSGASHINLRDVSSGAFDANLLVSSITSTGSDIELSLQYKTA